MCFWEFFEMQDSDITYFDSPQPLLEQKKHLGMDLQSNILVIEVKIIQAENYEI
jgi:hypothetical protein